MDVVCHVLEECAAIRNTVLVAGLWFLFKTAVWLLTSLWSGTKAFILSDLFRVKLKPSSFGWAVVTGASDGIGKEYAKQLAKCGLNVVLVSRSLDKLKAVEKEILEQYNVSIKIIVVDFSGGTEIYDKISTELSGLEVGILINNVGVSYKYPDYFLNVPEDRLWQLINVNVAAVVMMTKMVLPDMLEKKRGIIVNVSSGIALSPSPLLGVYAATKIFMDYFTSAIQYEYSGRGVTIQSVLPGFVATKMSGIRKPTFMAPSPQKYVSDALATIGVQSRTFGTISHAIQGFMFDVLPSWFIIRGIYYGFNNLRKAIIKRKQKKQ